MCAGKMENAFEVGRCDVTKGDDSAIQVNGDILNKMTCGIANKNVLART